MQQRTGVGSTSFPADAYPQTRAVVRVRPHHMHGKVLQNAVNQAARQAGIMKRVGTHTLRHTPFVSPGLAKGA